jgi:hypothetical protein
MKRRNALAQVALAVGAVIDATRSERITVKPVAKFTGNPARVIEKDRVYQSATLDADFPCTGIELVEYNYSLGSVKELYSENFTGEKLVKFSEPASNLAITNGTIISSGANHAYISSVGGTCTLSGRPYIETRSSVVIKSGGLLEGTAEKTEKIENCRLVNKSNSQAVAQRLYEYYLLHKIWDGDFILDGETIGGIAKVATAFESDGSYFSGRIEKLTLYPGVKNIKARGIFVGD